MKQLTFCLSTLFFLTMVSCGEEPKNEEQQEEETLETVEEVFEESIEEVFEETLEEDFSEITEGLEEGVDFIVAEEELDFGSMTVGDESMENDDYWYPYCDTESKRLGGFGYRDYNRAFSVTLNHTQNVCCVSHTTNVYKQ